VSEKLLLGLGIVSMCFRDAMPRSGCALENATGVSRNGRSSVFLAFGELAVGEGQEKFIAKNVVKRGARMFLTQVTENAAKIKVIIAQTHQLCYRPRMTVGAVRLAACVYL
jgi:hypothetical protein